MGLHRASLFFFFNDTATTEIYTLSLHDALPISPAAPDEAQGDSWRVTTRQVIALLHEVERLREVRSEEHTSELQSRLHLVCRLLLEKKKHKECLKDAAPNTCRKVTHIALR